MHAASFLLGINIGIQSHSCMVLGDSSVIPKTKQVLGAIKQFSLESIVREKSFKMIETTNVPTFEHCVSVYSPSKKIRIGCSIAKSGDENGKVRASTYTCAVAQHRWSIETINEITYIKSLHLKDHFLCLNHQDIIYTSVTETSEAYWYLKKSEHFENGYFICSKDSDRRLSASDDSYIYGSRDWGDDETWILEDLTAELCFIKSSTSLFVSGCDSFAPK
jgi:hypothetical protein